VSQPEYVPVRQLDRLRVTERLPTPGRWRADRPAEVVTRGGQPAGARFGVAGPDQGFALHLAERFVPDLVLGRGERTEDAVAGCVGVALKRAALFGRAPVVHDVELALALYGFLPGAPEDLVAWRRPLFEAVAHDYEAQRALVDRVPVSTLRMTPSEVRAWLGGGGWRALLGEQGLGEQGLGEQGLGEQGQGEHDQGEQG